MEKMKVQIRENKEQKEEMLRKGSEDPRWQKQRRRQEELLKCIDAVISKQEEVAREIDFRQQREAYEQHKRMYPAKSVSDIWGGRPKSRLVKWLMDKGDRTLSDIASCLGCSTAYLNNKLHRDSFSFEELLVIAYICGYVVTLISNDTKGAEDSKREPYQIDVMEHLRANQSNAKLLDSLVQFKKDEEEKRYIEYKKLKEKVERMKAEYGYQD